MRFTAWMRGKIDGPGLVKLLQVVFEHGDFLVLFQESVPLAELVVLIHHSFEELYGSASTQQRASPDRHGGVLTEAMLV